MVKLLIIADDFTGALDTGVQFAERGVYTEVFNDINYDLTEIKESVDVLVINAETRHCSADEAYRIVYSICKRALEYGIAYIYKKTDSALRGNIGSELAALLHVSEAQVLPFVPAFPKMNRITINGIHYINGIPVHQSVFGQDLFEPVRASYIPELINTQNNVPVQVVSLNDNLDGFLLGEKSKIIVFDSTTDEEMWERAVSLKKSGHLKVMAGCAGFASVLPEILCLGRNDIARPELSSRFLVVCGSINPITKEQIAYACDNGFKRITLNLHQKLDPSYYNTQAGREFILYLKRICSQEKLLIIDTNDSDESNDTIAYAEEKKLSLHDIRNLISSTLGYIIKILMDEGLDSTMLITGGDTMLGYMKQFDDCKIVPICQMETGVVLSEFILNGQSVKVISKSGGFGSKELLVDLGAKLVIE